MNPVLEPLELLLGPLFPGALAPEHRADLEKSTLTPETIRAQGFRSVPAAGFRSLLGFDPHGIRSGYLLPHPAPSGGFFAHVYIRIFPPITTRDGRTMKYVTPRGAAPRLYFNRNVLPDVLEGSAPLWCVEGAKKSSAVAQLNLPAIGYAGAECWHQRGSLALLDDFAEIPLEGRAVKVWPDADWQANPQVKLGLQRFLAALAGRGAMPLVVVPPVLPEVAA